MNKMEKTEINTVIEQIDDSVNKTTDESENLLTIVLPTLVIIMLLKKMLKYGNKNEKIIVADDNNKLTNKENNDNLIQKPCRLYEAIYEAAFSSLSDIDTSKKEAFPIIISKHCSHITGHRHSHMQSFFSLYNNLGLNYVKHFIHCSIIRFTPISTITSRKELEYYKKRVLKEENKIEELQKQISFLNLKYHSVLEQIRIERNAREISEKCYKESNKKLEDQLGEYMSKCDDLKDDNDSLRRKLEDSKKDSIQNFNNFNSGDYDSDYGDDNNCLNNESHTVTNNINNIMFKRQEEQRQNEEEANQLLSDLDQKGMDDFVSKFQDGKYNFKEIVSLILDQLFISDLNAVQVSIELDQFVKKCEANQIGKKYDVKKEVLNAIVEVICKLVEKKNQKKINICALDVIQKYVSLFQEYLGNSKKDKLYFLTLIFNHCKIINTVKPIFVNIVNKLYKLNIIDEDTILSWYNSQNKEDIKRIIDNSGNLEKLLETLNLEYLKKNMILKKEFDIYGDCNDSGFCSSGEDEMNEYLTSNGQFLESNNLESSDYEEDHSYDSWEMLENESIPCHCCNCNGKQHEVYNTSILKEKSHVRFEEPDVYPDHLLLENSNHEEIILKEDYDHSNGECNHRRCLLDIVEDEEEDESNSFIIQDINGEHIFSNNENLLDDYCNNNECDQSYASTISMNSMESQDYHLENDNIGENIGYCSDCMVKNLKSDNLSSSSIDYRNYYQEDDVEEIESSFTKYKEKIIEKVEEQIEEYCIIDKNNTDDIESEDEREYEEYEEYEEENRVDIEFYYEKENCIEENEEDDDEDEEDEEDDEEEDDEDDDEDEEDDEEEEDEEEDDKEEEDQEDADFEICFEHNDECKDNDYEICFENDEEDETSEDDDDEEDEDEDESEEEEDDDEDDEEDEEDEEEDEEESDEESEEENENKYKNEDKMISYKRSNSDNEIYGYIVEHNHLNNRRKVERMISKNTYSEPDELECESDSDNGIEIVFEGHSDAETEIYSDESEDEDRTYDSESDDGSDTEYDEEKIEKIANLRLKLPSDDFINHSENYEEEEEEEEEFFDRQSSSKELKSYTHSSDSAVVLDNSIEEGYNVHRRGSSNDINSDINEIIYDSEIDVVLCSSDCTIEISDDQGEINNYNAIKRNLQIEEGEEENNANLYPDLEKIKEDGQRKYLNKNIRKKLNCNKDTTNFKDIINFCKLKPEIKNDIEDYIVNKYGNLYKNDTSTNSKANMKQCHFNYIKRSINKSKKSTKKSTKKHCIKNENFLNKSSLRNIN